MTQFMQQCGLVVRGNIYNFLRFYVARPDFARVIYKPAAVIVCHALKNIADRADLLIFRDVLGKIDATDAEIDEVRSIMRRACSLDYAIQTAEEYVNRAIGYLDALKPSKDKDFMIALAEYTMTRTL